MVRLLVLIVVCFCTTAEASERLKNTLTNVWNTTTNTASQRLNKVVQPRFTPTPPKPPIFSNPTNVPQEENDGDFNKYSKDLDKQHEEFLNRQQAITTSSSNTSSQASLANLHKLLIQIEQIFALNKDTTLAIRIANSYLKQANIKDEYKMLCTNDALWRFLGEISENRNHFLQQLHSYYETLEVYIGILEAHGRKAANQELITTLMPHLLKKLGGATVIKKATELSKNEQAYTLFHIFIQASREKQVNKKTPSSPKSTLPSLSPEQIVGKLSLLSRNVRVLQSISS